MEVKSARCLINSISRFILLVSCQTFTLTPTRRDFESMAVLMKHLKPFLDEIVDEKISPDEGLLKECEKLDIDINEAREYIERWSSKASKILSVWQSEPVLNKMRSSSLEICRKLCRLLRTSSSSALADVQVLMQEFQSWQPNIVLTHIQKVSRDQNAKELVEIIESLGLTSNQELLKERIAIEKEKMKAQANGAKVEIGKIFQAANLVSLILDYMLRSGYFDSAYRFSIPSHFRCPLSLELMVDPVIVASGQTFERACIQEWIDHGLNFCPKTGEPLSHTNVIPNYTIKAMILSWFEENNHESLSKPNTGLNLTAATQSNRALGQDFIRMNSFQGSQHGSNSTSRSSIDEPYGFSKEVSSPTATETSRVSDRLEKVQIHNHSSISGIGSYSSKPSTDNNYARTDSFQSSDVGSDETTSYSYVEKLVEELKSQSSQVQALAASELRLLAKHNMENRLMIGRCGAIGPLIKLLYSDVKITQEHAVTALLNLSIHEEIKAMIAESAVIEPLTHVLKSGNDAAKENSAAALFSLAVSEELRLKIGRSGAVKALVNLLGKGTVRGKKDALTAMFNLSICHENKARIVQAGAVKHLVELLDEGSGLVDKAIALVANLVTVSEGRTGIVREGGIPMIVEVLDCGSQRGKENAASTLLQLCLNSDKFCGMVLQEGAVPPLVALSQTGTPRAREKAQQLLGHFRSQREIGTPGKKKTPRQR